jgi:alkyldihydroxyacetonephosphate synthase
VTDRERSFWGWGYADRFPDEAERRDLAARFEDELGFPERPLLEPPTLASASAPEPTLSVPDDLESFCTADREARIRHTYGRGYRDLVRGFYGEFDPAPDLVARPTEESEIRDLLAWAGEERVAVIPVGGGTSVVAGTEPDVDGGYAGVVSLNLREMDRVLEVDEHSRRARIQAGALGPEINDQLAEHDLQLRHYPQSYEFSTLGGWIATRAGGHFATVYTHIDDFVENVRAVTPAGALETLDVPASGAGPDPNRFLLGSEGAFGAITESWVRVQPRPPYRSRVTVQFDDFGSAVAATREIAQARLYPANCRLLDAAEAMINELGTGSHVLVLGFESVDHPVEEQLDRALEICDEHGGRCPDGPTHEDRTAGKTNDREDTEGEWRNSFFEAPYTFNALVSIGVLVDTFETAVTWDRFPDLHAALQQEVPATMADVCGGGVLSCRFTHVYPDGPAPYYTLLAPADPGNELEQWEAIKRTASDVLAEHDATITHHHAVGRVHREWYERESPDAYLEALRSMKRTLDPEGIMNPGALLSE